MIWWDSEGQHDTETTIQRLHREMQECYRDIVDLDARKKTLEERLAVAERAFEECRQSRRGNEGKVTP